MGSVCRRPSHRRRLSPSSRGRCDHHAGHVCLGGVAFFRSTHFGRRTSEPASAPKFRAIGTLVPSTLVEDFCPEPREDSLRLAILSPGNGSAGGARGGVVPALGADGSRSDRPHRISKPSDRRRTRGLALAFPPPSLHGNGRWGTRSSNLALAAAEPKSVRKNPELRIILCLGRGQRVGSA